MRRTANADLPAFNEIDARAAGIDAHVTAAAQDGFRLAADDFDTHGSGDANRFAVDDPHEVGRRFVGGSSGYGDQRSADDGHTCRRNCGAARACVRIGAGRHSVILPATDAESLAYTIRRRVNDRT